jgi:hypothetical protein
MFIANSPIYNCPEVGIFPDVSVLIGITGTGGKMERGPFITDVYPSAVNNKDPVPVPVKLKSVNAATPPDELAVVVPPRLKVPETEDADMAYVPDVMRLLLLS